MDILGVKMSLFYFDNDIRIAEEKLDFSSAILRTESLLKHSEDSKYVATLIINAWFYFVEGDVNRNPINYQWQFFKEKWQQYIDTGLTLYDTKSDVCFAAAYTLGLHGFLLGESYTKLSDVLYKRCIRYCNDSSLLELADYYYNKKNARSFPNKIKICSDLFPNPSLIDAYFNDVIK